MRVDVMHPADQIITIMERIYGYGMTTTSGGNLSIMDESGDIWITPSGIDKGSLTRDDIMRVTPSGEVIGRHKPSIELPFHASLYKKRPDIKAVLHAHPPALVAYSIVRKIPQTNIIPNVKQICGDIKMAEYDLPGSIRLGEKIAKVFDEGTNTVMMENHGVVIVAEDLFKAFFAFETIEYCAKLEINASSIGTIRALNDKNLHTAATKGHPLMEEFVPTAYSSDERDARTKICAFIKRSYEQRLFTSSQGTFSQRLQGNDFVITPYGMDRKYLQPEDMVTIKNGKKEAGKMPSRSALLHKAIYEKNPDVNAIIIAHPHYSMAYAITDAQFDSRTIPESYINLRYVKKLPFGSSFLQPEMTADTMSIANPVSLVQNDCVIAVGTSLVNAFDRLEVLEYSAKALIAAANIGNVTMISDEQVEEIDQAFNLQ